MSGRETVEPSSDASETARVTQHNQPSTSNSYTSTRLYLAFSALAVMTLMVALDSTSIAVALPIVATELRGSALEAFWSGTSFLLASTVFQPSFASLSHIFGRARLILTALVVFLIGAVVAAVSHSFSMLLTGRSLQGVGAGGIITLTQVVITDLVPLRQRGKWASIIASMWAIGSVAGPVIGGAFAQEATWRWIFWINLPFIGIAIIMVPLFIRHRQAGSSLRSKLDRIDWGGSVLFIGSITSFLVPISWGGVMYDWSSWKTLVPLLLGLAGIVGFALYEYHLSEEPLIRPSIFANRTLIIGYASTVIHGIVLWSLLYYQPLYFEAVKDLNQVMSGVALFPASLTVAPAGVATGIIITKTGTVRWPVRVGWLLATAGIGSLICLEVDSSTAVWVSVELVTGLGLGILFPALLFQVQAAASERDAASAASMFSFFRSFGQTIGLAVSETIFQNEMVRNLARSRKYGEHAVELAKDAVMLVQTISEEPDYTEREALKAAYTDSVRVIYILLCALSGLALISAAFVKHYDMNAPLARESGNDSGPQQGSTHGTKLKVFRPKQHDVGST